VELTNINQEQILSIVVVNSGLGSKVLGEAKKIGVSGGTIFLGRGTVKNHILELLGLEEVKKEIVVMISSNQLEEKLHEVISKKFHLEKPNHGIVLSLPVKKVFGMRESSTSVVNTKIGGQGGMEYEAIFTIVDRGLGEDVVDAANSAGARGATIINARGSGIHETKKFFAMNIEPEKEIVMIVIKKEKSDDVIKNIREKMKIDEPGRGIIFVLDVNKTTGLFREEDHKK
jgi:nitrogen regulatory protein PII